MKNILFAIAVIAGLALSSCYVGVEGGRRHHRHRPSLEIRTSDNTNQKDSLQSPAMGNMNQKDSLSVPANSDVIK